MSTKQQNISDAAFKAWAFSSDVNFTCRDGQVTAGTSKCYCQMFVSPTVTNSCKEFHFRCGRVPISVFENIAMHEK